MRLIGQDGTKRPRVDRQHRISNTLGVTAPATRDARISEAGNDRISEAGNVRISQEA